MMNLTFDIDACDDLAFPFERILLKYFRRLPFDVTYIALDNIVVVYIAIDAGGLGFNSDLGLIGHKRQRLAMHNCDLSSERCVAQALSRGDGHRHSLHA